MSQGFDHDPASDAAVTQGTTAPTKVVVVGGKTNDGTPQYREIPEGAGGRSVIVEGVAGGTAVPISGTVSTGGLTDTQLRATPVPVSGTVAVTAAALPLPSNAAIETGGNLAALVTAIAGLLLAQGSTTSAQTGPLIQAAVTDTPASALDGTTRPLSLDQDGRLRVASSPDDGSRSPWRAGSSFSTAEADSAWGGSAW